MENCKSHLPWFRPVCLCQDGTGKVAKPLPSTWWREDLHTGPCHRAQLPCSIPCWRSMGRQAFPTSIPSHLAFLPLPGIHVALPYSRVTLRVQSPSRVQKISLLWDTALTPSCFPRASASSSHYFRAFHGSPTYSLGFLFQAVFSHPFYEVQVFQAAT